MCLQWFVYSSMDFPGENRNSYDTLRIHGYGYIEVFVFLVFLKNTKTYKNFRKSLNKHENFYFFKNL